MLLDRIDSPADLKRLDRREIEVLAREIRDVLIHTCSLNGGHLAPNLGVVELTLALHRVLDAPTDKIVWDVSHQTYVQKLLTGRRGRFSTIRTGGGLSGFASREESEYDAFGAGHASTSVSAAVGMAVARDLRDGNETVLAVIGDGSLTGGLAYEALNNAGEMRSNFIVVLNDNEMSIAPNVGSIASYLSVLRSRPLSNFARQLGKRVSERLPFGETAKKAVEAAEIAAMHFVVPERTAVIFEELGFRYIGPIDGHNFDALVDVIELARRIPRAVLVHVRTTKGRGYAPAERDARTFHGVPAFPLESEEDTGVVAAPAIGKKRPTYSDAFADALIRLGREDERVIGITAAMPDGTKLSKFAAEFPSRAFDVGIAEAHAVCFAAGAAASGLRPVCAIYSTFLQRAYDQIVHDVCVQNLPVMFCLDRAGLVGDDGPTHMGLYDIAYLRTIPNMVLMSPRNEAELEPMMRHALSLDGPAAIRYPRGSGARADGPPSTPIEHGRAEVLHEGKDVAILAYGHAVDVALDAFDACVLHGVRPTVVNMRFAKPLDEALLRALARTHRAFVTVEEHALAGGFGSAVLETAERLRLNVETECAGVDDVLVRHDAQHRQREAYGLTGTAIAQRVQHLSLRARSVDDAEEATDAASDPAEERVVVP